MESANNNGIYTDIAQNGMPTSVMNKVKPTAKTTIKSDAQKPVHIVREGAIAASIWLRQAANGFGYYDFTLSRSWKVQSSGRTGYSQNYFADNSQALVHVIAGATKWIQEQTPQVSQPS